MIVSSALSQARSLILGRVHAKTAFGIMVNHTFEWFDLHNAKAK